jgi:hypothetical protein
LPGTRPRTVPHRRPGERSQGRPSGASSA